jgi:hypothetical protein
MIRACILSLALASPAYAQQSPCMPTHAEAVAFLAEKYGEVPIGYGLARNEASVIEVFVSKGGSWTIVRVLPSGQTCNIADGYGWVFVDLPWPVPGAPT